MLIALALGLALATVLQAVDADGAAIYRAACARCHDSGEGRAPRLEMLRQFPQDAIVHSLKAGNMRFVGARMRPASLAAVAAYVSNVDAEPAPLQEAVFACESAAFANPFEGPRWIGWGADLANRHFQSAAMAGLSRADVPRLELKWAFGFRGATKARGHPAVAGGRVSIGSDTGTVYSLDAKTGCLHWRVEARGGVRGAVIFGPGPDSGRSVAYFGDQRANLYAVDAETGNELWRNQIDEHPAALITASPTLHDGRLYAALSSFVDLLGSRANIRVLQVSGSARGSRRLLGRTTLEEPHDS